MERDALKTLWTTCFGDEDGWIDALFTTVVRDRNTCRVFREGKTAAALCWMDTECEGRPLAYLYAVATAPAFRRQGLCRELMDKTHALLARRGYAGAIVVPADENLRTLYRKLRYVNFGGMSLLSARAGTPAALRRLCAKEYATLRRYYLPPGGVIQEHGAEDFLAAGSALYAGEDFLVAMSDDFGLELLGNPQAAPGILSALGLERGTFRVPGDKPFAMYHSLTGDGWAPGYFGLAFE